jgi:hypothetical protein
MTVANLGDLLRAQLHFASTVVDHDKIVTCTIHLCESQHGNRVSQRFSDAKCALIVGRQDIATPCLIES